MIISWDFHWLGLVGVGIPLTSLLDRVQFKVANTSFVAPPADVIWLALGDFRGLWCAEVFRVVEGFLGWRRLQDRVGCGFSSRTLVFDLKLDCIYIFRLFVFKLCRLI